jgi:signal transduction histidine kinase
MRASSAERPGHLGLLGMRERALAIGAQLTIRAIDGEADDPGTEVFLAWPAPATEDDR